MKKNLDELDNIAALLIKHLKNELTADERILLTDWCDTRPEHEELFRKLEDEKILTAQLSEIGNLNGEIQKRITAVTGVNFTIQAPIVIREMKLAGSRRTWMRWSAVAAIFLLVAVSSYFLLFDNPGRQEGIVTNATTTDIQSPQINRAMIRLGNGETVYLDSVGNGTVAIQENVQVVKDTEGRITYSGASESVIYNTLINPRGSKPIDMTMADGSRVWLNAGSSVTYPVSFPGKERRVSINGEAYFEIAHDGGKPFVVTKETTEITVLGTHFNVKAYDDEPLLRVTLLEGSVQVGSLVSKLIIKPGQQAITNAGGELSVVDDVEIDLVMAWKNGQFAFKGTELSMIMKEVGRWYDVDVSFQGNMGRIKYSGKISRNLSLIQFLKILDETRIKYKLNGKNLTITS